MPSPGEDELFSRILTYDGANRHVQTVKGATTVRYVRDATDRIVERRVNGAVVARYAYSASGDTGDATLDGLGTMVEATIPLIGGVMLITRTAGNVWSYPNIHGDVMITANASGVKQGSVLNYDPFGQALSTVPDNSAGNFDYGVARPAPAAHRDRGRVGHLLAFLGFLAAWTDRSFGLLRLLNQEWFKQVGEWLMRLGLAAATAGAVAHIIT